MKKAWRDASRKKEESEWPTRGQKIERERESQERESET